MNAETYGSTLRTCGGCKASFLSTDEVTPTVLCKKCQAVKPPFNDWAAGLKEGDLVYLQPSCVKDPLFRRSRHMILSRDGDMLDVQPIGCPNGRVKVHVGNVADHDVAPWRGCALY